MRKFGYAFFVILALPAFAEDAPIIVPSKSYVDSGLLQKAPKAFQLRAEGFATAAQGDKADTLDTALSVNNTIEKANTALQSVDMDGYATTTYVGQLESGISTNHGDILTNTARIADLADSISDSVSGKADLADLSSVAFSGDFNDLTNKPISGVIRESVSSIYEVRSNSISGAVSGDSFGVEMDGFVFKAVKQNAANYWAVRVENVSGQTRSISTSFMQIYGGVQGVTKENLAFAHGAEHNPDTESGDIGYGKQDSVVVYLFDHANMHLYRWTVSVFTNKAAMGVGKFH